MKDFDLKESDTVKLKENGQLMDVVEIKYRENIQNREKSPTGYVLCSWFPLNAEKNTRKEFYYTDLEFVKRGTV
jgi:uncharacterized protein YodC (DUF2158 family)